MQVTDIWTLITANFIGFLIVLARVSGIFGFNPVLNRANVPMSVKAGASLVMAVLFFSAMNGKIGFIPSNLADLALIIIFEMLLGITLGFIVNLIITVLIYAGEIVDNQIGLGMAKAMDPSTGIQMPVFANLYYYLFALYFFITDSHLEYVKLFRISYDVIPIGFTLNLTTLSLVYNIVMFLGTVFALACKLAMPVIAAELIVEVCVGVMMKAVPTIQIFAVNIQMKIIAGLLVISAIAEPISNFITKLTAIMWNNLDKTLHGFV